MLKFIAASLLLGLAGLNPSLGKPVVFWAPDSVEPGNIVLLYGGGLRIALNQTERLNLRLDYGIGAGKSNGFYLQLGEAF